VRIPLLTRGVLLGGLACAAFAQDWTHYVRIAGHGLKADNAAQIVAESTKSHVFGIEVDNDIPGRYESWLDPAAKLKAIRAVAQAAHAAGNKSFVYIAGLECITAHADQSPHSFFKDHPDWVQRTIDGKPAVFGGGVAFWVAKGDEDVWITPFAPAWRAHYMEIVRQIAGTGIDGVYVDIPYWMTHFEGWEKTWASFDDYTVAAFRKETGLDARHDIRLNDPADAGFRRWVDFRIRAITDFMQDIDRNVKAVNPKCVTIAEIFPGIEDAAPRVGADVYQLYGVVDAIAHEYQGPGDLMAASKSAYDWFDQMIGMFAFRAFAGPRATWMLNYSWDGEKKVSIPEAMKTMFAAQLTAGANTWDARGHVMSGSNDLAMRTQAFAWIAKHEKLFYDAREPLSPIGVYFSPATRNYFPDEFTASFKGFMNLLLMAHREFQIVTPKTLAQFHGSLLILPDVRCLSDEEVAALRGRHLLVAGKTGSLNIDGSARSTNPFAGAAGDDGARFESLVHDSFAAAAADGHWEDRPFWTFLSDFRRRTLDPIEPAIRVEAPPFVVAQIARVHGKPYVFLDNFDGIVAKQNALPRPEARVTISFPESAGGRAYVLPFLGEQSEVPAARRGGKLIITAPAFTRSIVVWVE